MDVAAAREALVGIDGGFADEEVAPLGSGWSFETFRIGVGHVARFPRGDASVVGLEREIALLPKLASRVSFAVPEPVVSGQYDGRPFVVARFLEGRAIASCDVVSTEAASPEHAGDCRARLAQVLAELHGFPRKQAVELLGVDPSTDGWRERYVQLQEEIAEKVEPLLDVRLRDRVVVGFARFLEDGLASFAHPVLAHCDLGVTAMLDFEGAGVGDPAIDFVGLQIAFGDDVVRDVLARYGGPPDPGFGTRLHFYVWMGAVHAILHGLDTADDALVAGATKNLARRIEI
jgi:aminoglycoside phosphotransferase (APT) family kinase protein